MFYFIYVYKIVQRQWIILPENTRPNIGLRLPKCRRDMWQGKISTWSHKKNCTGDILHRHAQYHHPSGDVLSRHWPYLPLIPAFTLPTIKTKTTANGPYRLEIYPTQPPKWRFEVGWNDWLQCKSKLSANLNFRARVFKGTTDRNLEANDVLTECSSIFFKEQAKQLGRGRGLKSTSFKSGLTEKISWPFSLRARTFEKIFQVTVLGQ